MSTHDDGARADERSPPYRKSVLTVGEPAPWFRCDTTERRDYAFDSVGGLNVVLSFLGSASCPESAAYLREISRARRRFDDRHACFFGVTVDRADAAEGRIVESVPGLRFFVDTQRQVSAMYGAALENGGYRPVTYVLDACLRVQAVIGWEASGKDHARAVLDVLDRLLVEPPPGLAPPQAPVLVLPNVFEPALCDALVQYYESVGGEDSGFMIEVDGMTRGAIDYGHKRRSDVSIEDQTLRHSCMVRIHDRLAPMVKRVFQFDVTRMERYIVACYDGSDRGHFRRHRDNTTRGTAHRRFAVSLFLNTGHYEGGWLRFPEFGSRLYGAPAGGAVVFSCALLHEATPVTRGRRYMFLPFLYDEAARALRERNLSYVTASDDERRTLPESTPSATQHPNP